MQLGRLAAPSGATAGARKSAAAQVQRYVVDRHSAPSRHWGSSKRQRHQASAGAAQAPVRPEAEVPGLGKFLNSLKYDSNGLVAVIVQHVDTGEVLMQAFADRAALAETMQTRLATFYSRSRKGRWCKGESSGHFIKVLRVFTDCDNDSIIYLSDPIGPACHTGAKTCWFTEACGDHDHVHIHGAHTSADNVPLTTLYALEKTIADRRRAAEAAAAPAAPDAKPSWTVRLLQSPELLCKKVREEAGELCQTLEANEGRERAASEAADLLYHAMVLLNLQGVPMEEVMAVLRKRFGTSGVEEKASRAPPKTAA